MIKKHKRMFFLLAYFALFFLSSCSSKEEVFFDKYDEVVSGWEKKAANGKLSVHEAQMMYNEIETLEMRNAKIWQDNSRWSEMEMIRWNHLNERKSRLLGW